jgi:hypothetical protein
MIPSSCCKMILRGGGARNLKFILCLFEQLSGLKINFHKSEIFYLGGAAERKNCYADIFTFPTNNLPMKYLGSRLMIKKLCKTLWTPMVEKMENKLGSWQGRSLSLGGRLVLINSSLINVPLYMLSMYKALKIVIMKIDVYRKILLWQGGHNKKNHLVDWNLVCSPKDQGGLGVLDLKKNE